MMTKLSILALSCAALAGGLVSSYDDGNEVDGTFAVTVCPPDNQ